MSTPEALLAARRGLVVAPGGTGKTRLLVDTVVAAPAQRTLVLTHTRAGVAVIRSRLAEKSTKPSQCRVATLDNWCAWLASSFPGMSKFVQTFTPSDYRGARVGALNTLNSRAVHQALTATYHRILIDEYQDCDKLQHKLICKLGESVPVLALGDPMQRVFDFSPDGLPPWLEIERAFGTVWTLEYPWRWHKAGELDFGNWVLAQREALKAGGKLDLRAAPSNVKWISLPADPGQHRLCSLAAVPRPRTGTTLFVLTDRSNTAARRSFARDSVRLAVVENADLPDLAIWARTLEHAPPTRRIEKLLEFAYELMTGVDVAGIIGELNKLRQRSREKPATEEENLLLALSKSTSTADLSRVLERMASKRNVYRPELMEAFCDAARLATLDTERTLSSAAEHVRDRRASEGRRVGTRAVGSTLLLKGLEADHALVIDADGMKAVDFR